MPPNTHTLTRRLHDEGFNDPGVQEEISPLSFFTFQINFEAH